ncbi:MAG: DUF4440 domain-containing protein [Gammaproteobacteria bacterium]|nr:DUF4440 domain-containing protein [Gammaproteobacteria bacterium]
MKRNFGVLVTVLLVLTALGACSDAPTDYSAKAAQEILEADQEFAWLAERSSVTHAFNTYRAEGAVLLPNGGGPLRGEALEAALETMDYNLEWAPEEAWGAASGDFGVSWGYWTLRAIDPEGNPVVRHGKYSTVWKKNAEGEWRWVMDMGNDGPLPEAR